MAPQLPAGGLSIRMAFDHLLPDQMRPALAAFKQEEARLPESSLRAVIQMLWSEIVRMALVGEVIIEGITGQARNSEPIPLGVLPTSHANIAGNSLQTDIGEVLGVLIRVSGPVVNEANTLQETMPTSASSSPKGRGGTGPKHDWTPFIQEIVRFANLDGLQTRRELTAHMRGWCATTMGDKSPDAETIRRKVIEYCPPDLPPE